MEPVTTGLDGLSIATTRLIRRPEPRGKWSIETRQIRIYWGGNFWETFWRPLDQDETSGDSWQGNAIVRATKCRPMTLGGPSACVGPWRVAFNSHEPDTFVIELHNDYTAIRHSAPETPQVTSTWKLENGQVTIPWPDDWTDVYARLI